MSLLLWKPMISNLSVSPKFSPLGPVVTFLISPVGGKRLFLRFFEAFGTFGPRGTYVKTYLEK